MKHALVNDNNGIMVIPSQSEEVNFFFLVGQATFFIYLSHIWMRFISYNAPHQANAIHLIEQYSGDCSLQFLNRYDDRCSSKFPT